MVVGSPMWEGYLVGTPGWLMELVRLQVWWSIWGSGWAALGLLWACTEIRRGDMVKCVVTTARCKKVRAVWGLMVETGDDDVRRVVRGC